MKTKLIIGLTVGAVLGVVGKRWYDERNLEKKSGPGKKWSEKTIKEKEAWIKLHVDSSPTGVGILKEDLEMQKRVEGMKVTED